MTYHKLISIRQAMAAMYAEIHNPGAARADGFDLELVIAQAYNLLAELIQAEKEIEEHASKYESEAC
jgi:hypothetical protein